MAKTTEQLLQQAVQIRDEQANKKNTALRVGTLFSDIIEKQEESDQTHASDVTKINESINENKDKLTELGNNVFRTGSGGYLPWQAGKTYNDGDVVIAPDGLLVECIGGTTSTSEYDPGEWAATTVDEQSKKRDAVLGGKISELGNNLIEASLQNKPIGFIGRQESAINIPLKEPLVLNEPFAFIISADYIGNEEGSTAVVVYASGIYLNQGLFIQNGEFRVQLGAGAYFSNLCCSKASKAGVFGICKKTGENTVSFAHSSLKTVNIQEQTSTINTFMFLGSNEVLTKKILLIKGDLNNEDLRVLTTYMTNCFIKLPSHIKEKVVFGIDNTRVREDRFINISNDSEVKFVTPVTLVYEGINVESKSW